jgi:hypothetical protein
MYQKEGCPVLETIRGLLLLMCIGKSKEVWKDPGLGGRENWLKEESLKEHR